MLKPIEEELRDRLKKSPHRQIQIGLTVSPEEHKQLERLAKKFNTKKSTLAKTLLLMGLEAVNEIK
jgi:hypothetical protein